MIKVVNIRTHIPTDRDVYIGRGSPLGNPYSHMERSLAQHIVETREESILRYSEWLKDAVRRNDSSVASELERIYGLHKEGVVHLVCHCHPKPCHGNVLRDMLLLRDKPGTSLENLWEAGGQN